VVTRYRIHLEDQLLAPGTINVRLAAVRRLAYEAADTGLLSPERAAGIRRVKGAKKLGMRLGNWLSVTEARALWQLPNPHTVKGKRDGAMLAVLLCCGLRRSELINLELDQYPTPRRSLGNRRSGREGDTYSDCADTGMGKADAGRVVGHSRYSTR
jgi:integrase